MILEKLFGREAAPAPGVLGGDDEMSDQELEVVIGGLARVWQGWDAAELGDTAAQDPAALRLP